MQKILICKNAILFFGITLNDFIINNFILNSE